MKVQRLWCLGSGCWASGSGFRFKVQVRVSLRAVVECLSLIGFRTLNPKP